MIAGQPFRLATGGRIDRGRVLAFTFNGRRYEGYPGDTLASALLANGVHLVARSFKYRRPRGIVTAGSAEPSALVQLGTGARSDPAIKATQAVLYDGLAAASINGYPSLNFDLAAAADRLSRFLPAGFYYKTFFASPWLWHRLYEPLLRQASGWGTAPAAADPDKYHRMHAHCDVLVVGGGPAGLAAAVAAAETEARVTLADEQEEFGGSLLERAVSIDGADSPSWAAEAVRKLESRPEVRLLPRTTIFGYYDGNHLCGLERRTDHLPPDARPDMPRQRLWHIHAGRVVLATGAHERPLVFADNDRPGIMLAGAVQAYVRRWGVLPGRRAILFTNNDRAYEAALALADAGADVAAVIDTRSAPEGPLVAAVRGRGIAVLAGHAIVATQGRRRVSAVEVARLSADRTSTEGAPRRIACDLVAVSGGTNPAVHLFSQSQGSLVYDETQACFRPGRSRQAERSVGACNGVFALAACLAEGIEAGREAAEAAGFAPGRPNLLEAAEPPAGQPMALWLVPGWKAAGAGWAKHFVDLQNDTTAADIGLAVREGFGSVEHMKRYTLAGFGTDQGKTSNVNALAILAQATGRPIAEVGTTTFRPPYTPVTFAAMGGRDRGALFEPARLTAMHDRHAAHGAVFEDVGQWKRPWYYPRPGEEMDAAVARECRAVRQGVGVLDASTLGKIDIQGPDAAEFLDRIYINGWKSLAVGGVRYGVMCREDGMVFDDGTTARLAEHRYLMTTTTGGAAAVLGHLEEYLQTEWTDLRVRLTSVTEQWAVAAIAGPRSRDVLAALAPGLDISKEAFPFMSWRDADVAGLPARIFRISFTGELQYELNVPWHFGEALWDALMEAGARFDIAPYGTEAMHVLRAEKGFVIVGQDTDGMQTPDDLGLRRMVSTKKNFIGRRSLSRSDCVRPGRHQLVGLLPENLNMVLPEGSQLVEQGTAGHPPPVPMLGFVTSSYWSPALRRGFCLALVADGRRRHGEVIEAALADRAVPVTICDPLFYDPEGRRRDGAES
ncbi:MAG TPA: sarcosine oxidase subunit alpha family protein [Afifellaceae bacterium]|nr:sarcosine oxidase subunit alpha family protein [Afifellaceae bacterium]